MKLLSWLVILLLATLKCLSQNCSSGQGDPIVNITFGSGVGIGPPLAAGITNMDYVAQECVGDNVYTITNQVSGCYVDDWLTVTKDHTGDPNGYFMLIGASFEPSTFYVQTVTGLCGSTQYQFGVWVLNMASHAGENLPNFTFSIQTTGGTPIQSFSTGDVPWHNPVQWIPYTFQFTTPPGVNSVVLQMTNTAPGGYGNDLCLDDITFRTLGPTVNVSVDGHTSDTVTLCTNSNLNFSSDIANSCYASTSYQWQQSIDNGTSWTPLAGASGSTYSASFATAGSYLYRLAAAAAGNISNVACQVVSTADTITALDSRNSSVTIAASGDSICAGKPVTFTASPADAGTGPTYEWMINGSPALAGQTTAAVFTDAPANGDQVSCIMSSEATCLTNPTTASNTVTMAVFPITSFSVAITASADMICSGTLVTFTAAPSGDDQNPKYQWLINGANVGDSTDSFATQGLRGDDLVTAVLTDNRGCSNPATSNIIAMTVYPTPTVYLSPDTVIAAHTTMQLLPQVSGEGLSYQWGNNIAPGANNLPDPYINPVTTTTYNLTVTSGDGCTASAKEVVDVFYDLIMPNAFTPNEDGKNDIFRVPPSNLTAIENFMVYDRWGALVFRGTGPGGWDGTFNGKLQPAGTYVWDIEYFDPIIKRELRKQGTVELIR